MKRPYPIVEVHWVDSSSWQGWVGWSILPDFPTDSMDCISVGLLLYEDAVRVVLALSVTGGSFWGVCAIPKVAVTKIVRVRR